MSPYYDLQGEYIMSRNLEQIKGTQLSDWRKSRGLSQQDLATMLGVSVATIKRWESGSIPSDRYLAAIAALMGGTAAAIRGLTGGSSALSVGLPLLGGLAPSFALGPIGAILVGIAALAGFAANQAGSKVAEELPDVTTTESLSEKDAQQEITKQLWQVLQQVSLKFPVPTGAEERAGSKKVELKINIDKVLSDKFQEEADIRGFTPSRLLESLLWLFLERPSLSFQKNDEGQEIHV